MIVTIFISLQEQSGGTEELWPSVMGSKVALAVHVSLFVRAISEPIFLDRRRAVRELVFEFSFFPLTEE